MSVISRKPKALMLAAALALPAWGSATAQQQQTAGFDSMTTVYGDDNFAEGPEIKGIITARSGDKLQVMSPDGNRTTILIGTGTEIKGTGGFLGTKRNRLGAEALLNGLPVEVKTLQSVEGLIASKIKFRNKDFKTANMIRNGTAQQFAAHGAAIDKNAAATEANAALADALRGRMGDIDKYNIKSSTNVYFASGKWKLTPQGRADLCNAAAEAEAMDNALLLVVGYTDSVGSQEYNQVLSERRAGGVVNHLQQACGWKPWRMLTPTGMAEADPLASNDTPEGKAQNRRVSVNILVSKGLDGL